MTAGDQLRRVFFVVLLPAMLLLFVASCGQNDSDDNGLIDTDDTVSYDISGDADGPGTTDTTNDPADDVTGEMDGDVDNDVGDESLNAGTSPADEQAADGDPQPGSSTSIAPAPIPPTTLADENPDDLAGGDANGGDTDGGVGDDAAEDPAADGRVDIDFPPAPLTDLASGQPVSLEGLVTGESYSLLWFWSPSSSTSEREAAVAQRLADRFPDAVSVLAIAADGDQQAAIDFRAMTGLTVTTLWASTAETSEHYGVAEIPSSVLLGSNGDVIARWPGLPEEAFRFIERIS